MRPNCGRMNRVSTPTAGALAAIAVGLVLYFATGIAAGKSNVVVSWTSFHQGDALIFLGAYAQLVLAGAVFFQIRTADRALLRQIEADDQKRRSEMAEA